MNIQLIMQSITKLLLDEMENDPLDVAKLTGFTSDGASVMLGSGCTIEESRPYFDQSSLHLSQARFVMC